MAKTKKAVKPTISTPNSIDIAARRCVADIYATISRIWERTFDDDNNGHDEEDEKLTEEKNETLQARTIFTTRSALIILSLPTANRTALRILLRSARGSLDDNTRTVADIMHEADSPGYQIRSRRLTTFVNDFGWLLLSVCAFSQKFRDSCQDVADEAIWTALCDLIRNYASSIELFAQSRSLPWEPPLTFSNLNWRDLILHIRQNIPGYYPSLTIRNAAYGSRLDLSGSDASHPHEWALASSNLAINPTFKYRRNGKSKLITERQVNINESIVMKIGWTNMKQWPGKTKDPRYRGFGAKYDDPCMACGRGLMTIKTSCGCTLADMPRKWTAGLNVQPNPVAPFAPDPKANGRPRRGASSHNETDQDTDNNAAKQDQGRFTRAKLLELINFPDKGVGVRALQNFAKDDILDEYVGEIFPESINLYQNGHGVHYRLRQGLACRKQTKYGSPIPLGKEDTMVIDPALKGNWTRYMSHSCRPNTIFEDANVGQKRLMLVRAARGIEFGEELTVHYGAAFWAGPGYPCRCGEKDCKYKDRRPVNDDGSSSDEAENENTPSSKSKKKASGPKASGPKASSTRRILKLTHKAANAETGDTAMEVSTAYGAATQASIAQTSSANAPPAQVPTPQAPTAQAHAAQASTVTAGTKRARWADERNRRAAKRAKRT